MISREEAERKSIMCSNKTMCCQGLVKDIYESIGSCGECSMWSKEYQSSDGSVGICRNDRFELRSVDTITDSCFFCADFERK